MNPPAKLAAFALALALVGGAGAALGRAAGPSGGDDDQPGRTTTTTMPATMDMDHTGR